jgi:hypothetical protein
MQRFINRRANSSGQNAAYKYYTTSPNLQATPSSTVLFRHVCAKYRLISGQRAPHPQQTTKVPRGAKEAPKYGAGAANFVGALSC